MKAKKSTHAASLTVLAVAGCCLFLLCSNLGFAEERSRGGRVFVMNNESSGNVIVMMDRSADGILTRSAEFSTGGQGSGPGPGPLPLESQDSLISARGGRFLLAVNAGSNTISALKVTDDGLQLTDVASSGGIFPDALAYHDGLVY